ncbi:MAG: hypothetical protein M3R13_05400 [Armatimonadota bacterium]|nr:hypothetical protein [Armatimonadota bacterium]
MKNKLCIAAALIFSVCTSSAEIVYSNMKFFSGDLFFLSWGHPSFREVGDEIFLAPGNRIVDRISFYWAAYLPVTFDVQLTFYKNDGSGVGGGVFRPQTVLWRQVFKNVTIKEKMELQRFDFDVPRIVVPDNFTYSTKLEVKPQAGPSYAKFGPPTTGTSGNWIWAATENPTTWTRYFLSGVDDFAAEVNAISEYDTQVPAESFFMARGSVVSGDLNSLFISDDNRLVMKPGTVFSFSEPPVQVILDAVAPTPSPIAFSFTMESAASFGNAEQTISLFNFDSGLYEVMDSRLAATTDNIIRIEMDSDPWRFIEPGTQVVRARVSYRAVGPAFAYPWLGTLDKVSWAFPK